MLDINSVPLDDKKTWDLICDGHTKGVFQIETPLGAMWSKRIKPRSIQELAALTALIRPGCLEAVVDGANMVEHYRRRKFWEEEVPALHPLVDEVLSPTYGVFVFQEQILEIARKIAGFSLSQAESLRKSMGKKKAELMAECKTLFIEGVKKEKLISEALGEDLWNQIEKSQRYLFNACVSGDTILRRDSSNKHKTVLTVEQMYWIRNNIEYAKKTGHLSLYKKWKLRGNYGKSFSLCDDGRIRLNVVKNIYLSGRQQLFKITLANGATIKVTAHHKFPTDNGTKTLENLAVGDKLYYGLSFVRSRTNYNHSTMRKNDIVKRYGDGSGRAVNHKYGDSNIGYTNGSWSQFQKYRKNQPKECTNCGTANRRIECHHINGNRYDSSENNLEMLCIKCHQLKEYQNGRTKKGQLGFATELIAIASIEPLEYEDVFDIEMEGPNHTFTTSTNIVTCNSHAIGYGLLSYKTAYLKAHYPLQFITALLIHAKDKNSSRFKIVGEVIRSAKHFDIEVRTPDLRKLEETFFIEDKHIRFGLSNIRGIGGAVYHELAGQIKEFESTLGPVSDWSWYTFLIKVSPYIRATSVEGLINTGALDFMGEHRARMLYEYSKYVNGTTPKERVWCETNCDEYTGLLGLMRDAARTKKEGGAAHRKDGVERLMEVISTLENPPYRLLDTPGQIAHLEQALLGAAITYDITETKDTYVVDTTIKEFLNGKSGFLTFGVQLVRVSVWKTKGGKTPGREMAFLDVADSTGEMGDVVVFPDTFKQCRSAIVEESVVLLSGERKKNKDKVSFVVSNVQTA